MAFSALPQDFGHDLFCPTLSVEVGFRFPCSHWALYSIESLAPFTTETDHRDQALGFIDTCWEKSVVGVHMGQGTMLLKGLGPDPLSFALVFVKFLCPSCKVPAGVCAGHEHWRAVLALECICFHASLDRESLKTFLVGCTSGCQFLQVQKG